MDQTMLVGADDAARPRGGSTPPGPRAAEVAEVAEVARVAEGLYPALDTLREFLVPRWIALHRTWPEPVPDLPSRFMCRYTAEFLHLLDPAWTPVLGLVSGQTHTWNEHPDGRFRDLTGDQFGLAPVQASDRRPPGYVPRRWTDAPPDRFRDRARIWLTALNAAHSMTASPPRPTAR